MPKLIAVCGVDGVGKTTVAKELAHRLGYEYVKTPPGSYQALRGFYEQEGVSAFSRFCFYLGAVHESSDAIRATLQRGASVIADRYIMSLMAYHEVLLRDDLQDYVELADFSPPTASILLTARIDVIRSRIEGRDKGFDSAREADIEYLASVQQRFGMRIPRAHTVDTSSLTIAGVVDCCMDIVRGLPDAFEPDRVWRSIGVA